MRIRQEVYFANCSGMEVIMSEAAKNLGMVCGFMVGLIIVVIIFKFVNRDNKAKTEYDERQLAIRGKGYMYGFYAICIYEAIISITTLYEVEFMTGFVSHMMAVIVGILVQASYCIWKGAYWGLNNNVKRYAVVFVIVGLINFLTSIQAAGEGELLAEGHFQPPFINLMCGVLFVILGIELLIKKYYDEKEGE